MHKPHNQMGTCFSSLETEKHEEILISVSKTKNSEEDHKSHKREMEEEKKDIRVRAGQLARKPMKKKAPVVDARRSEHTNADAPTAIVVDKTKTQRDIVIITASLNKHFIFTSLTEENREILIQHMKHFTLGANEHVFEQGQPGNNFFVVATGKVEVLINEQKKNILKAGDSFGELALMHDSPRSASIRTIERTTLWGLDRRTFRRAVEAVNAQNYQENKTFIESVPLLQILTHSQREALVGSLATLKFAPGEKIVKEGDPGDLFYIIKDGNVSCTKESREIRTMTRGDFFGEQALLYHSPRTATITALDDVKCVAIGRERLTRVLGSHLQQIIYRNSLRIALDRSHLMSKLNKEQSDKLFQTLQVRSAIEEDVIISKGTPKGRYVWFILKGSLKIKSQGVVAEQFSCFGEDEIVSTASTESFDEDIISDGEVHFAQLSREEFEHSIGGQYKSVTENNEAWSILRRVQLLRGLSTERLQALVHMLRIQDYSTGESIVQQNNPGDSFFIIKSGKVDVQKDGTLVRTITKHDYFGERSVLFNDFRSASIIANGNVSCWVLQKSDFISMIDENIRVQLLKRIELQDDNITLDDLTIVKTLGKGMFGNVFLVVHKEKRSLYALKTVDRRKIERYEIQENLQLERKILLQLDHTFILKLIKTFKDQRRIYFLMEFVRGHDLFDVLRQLGLVTDSDSRFYISSLIVILEHLHEREIIYRDLKPENVMVDEEGYPKLIDFGTAKIVQGRTYTIVGTPQYMAPEVILGKGYGVSADYWSIGVMLFEFLCGGVPFGEEEEDPYVIYEKVLEHKLVYPNWVDKKLPAKPFIEQLLSKNPAMRTGGSIEILKKHAWFTDFDWDKLLSRQVRAPFRPPINSFSSEISLALRKNNSTNLLISKEEDEDIPAPKQGRRAQVPGDWDAEF